jgi:RND family efflux transporter MFP subunit
MPPSESPPPFESSPPSEFPDDISLLESDRVSTAYAPGTGRSLKKAVIIAGGVLLCAFIAVRLARFSHDRGVARAGEVAYSAPPAVDTVVARPVSEEAPLVLPGQTASWYDSTLYARVDGYVANWTADIGDHVRKNQVLATLETPDLDAELNAARAQLKASEAQVVAREAEVQFAKTTNERWRDSPKGVVSEQERDAKKADYDTAEARLYAAKSQVALDQARVNQYAALTNFKKVTAPFDGIVTERRIDIGNLVTAGSTTNTTPLYHVSQSDPLRVFIDVPQNLAVDLMQTGTPAEIHSQDAPGDAIIGRIARSARAINVQARTMRVEVDVPNPDQKLVPGMYVTVAFHRAPKGVVEVPAAALVFRAQGPEVARVDANRKVEFRKVSIARDEGNLVELASGAQPGDRLILNISSQIASGQAVAVTGDDKGTRTSPAAVASTAAPLADEARK